MMFEHFRKGLKSIVDHFKYKELSEKTFNEIKDDLLILLIENDVSYEVAESILKEVESLIINRRYERSSSPYNVVKEFIKDHLFNILKESQRSSYLEDLYASKDEPRVILFMGFNGVGKTTTIAKLGYFHKQRGDKVLFTCSDTFRAGAIEQLIEHGKRLGIPTFKYEYGADPAAVGYDAIRYAKSKGYNIVLIDTAGRVHIDVNLMEELRKISRVVKPTLKILVLDALTGNDAYYQAKLFMEGVGFDGVIFTKVDADVKGGAIITVSYLYRKPIYFLGVGQNYKDLIIFNPTFFINSLFG